MALTDFGRRLDSLIHERFRSAARFCAAVEKLGGELSEAYLSRILHGERNPPIDALDTWIRALGVVDEAEIETLKIEAELAHLPESAAMVRRALRDFAAQTERDAKRIEKMQTQIEVLTQIAHRTNGPKPSNGR